MTRAVIAVAALVAVCACSDCGSQPKLPGGLPPEYEPGRAFELPAQPSAAPPAAPSTAPSVAPPAKPKPTE
ncbi:MAG TPA: hypothetical protein VGM56_19405 [Byssovorax sp.]